MGCLAVKEGIENQKNYQSSFLFQKYGAEKDMDRYRGPFRAVFDLPAGLCMHYVHCD
jgi:hypothetical protein